tara:strand:- start:17931 stop:18986 length:1056 start_codon:yes stop_codon:yes gene_type:complete
MKYLRLIVINFCIIIGLFFIVGVINHFVSVNRINSFFEMSEPNQVAYLQKDSIAMFVHIPNIQIYDNWGTPQQKLTTERKTNNLGFREDDDIVEKKQNEYRILVTGDSHTDGVLKHNPQSFINVWEDKLNASDTIVNYNCINGGTAYYTFRNYLGFLKKYSYLKPDIYLINIFIGNDFRETFLFEDDRTSIFNVSKNTSIRLYKRILTFRKAPIAMSQGIDQSLYFKFFPNEKEKALSIAKKYMIAIKDLCEKENIELIITLLPSKIETNAEFKSKIQSLFKLSPDEIHANEKLTNEFIKWLNSENITNFNLKAPLQQATEKVFWEQDLHINEKGHSIIGQYLFDTINIKK